MNLFRDNTYWFFNTSLQVIATFVGLLAAGFFFMHGKIDEAVKDDETLSEIYAEIKRQYYSRFKTLFALTAFSITLGLLVLYINVFDTGLIGQALVVLVGLLNIVNLIWAGWFFIYMIDPELVNHTADRLVKKNTSIFSNKNEHSISKGEFIGKFAALDKILRKVASKSEIGGAQSDFIPFTEVVKELYEKGVINKEQLLQLNQISKVRNISTHSPVENIESELGNSADKLNKELNVINSATK